MDYITNPLKLWIRVIIIIIIIIITVHTVPFFADFLTRVCYKTFRQSHTLATFTFPTSQQYVTRSVDFEFHYAAIWNETVTDRENSRDNCVLVTL